MSAAEVLDLQDDNQRVRDQPTSPTVRKPA